MDNAVLYSAQIKSVPDDSFLFARTTVVNVNKFISGNLKEILKQIHGSNYCKTSYDEKTNTTFYDETCNY